MPDADQLNQIESTITGAANTLTDILNIPAGPTAVIGFVAEGIFKAVRLGIAIKKAQEQANAELDAKIRAQSILRTPIVVDLSELDVRSFYEGGKHTNPFAVIGEQFDEEIKEFFDTGGNPSPHTFQILKAARQLVPQVHRTLRFEDEDLQQLLGIWLNPGNPDFRAMVLEYLHLFPDAELPYRDHYERMGNFWKDKLEIALKGITRAQIEAQAEIDARVHTLVTSAIFGESGFGAKVLDLSKKLKKASIDQEIARLEEEKKTSPQQQKDGIDAKIDALKKHKARIG